MNNPFSECNGWAADYEPQLRDRLSAELSGKELDYAVKAIQQHEQLKAEIGRLQTDLRKLEWAGTYVRMEQCCPVCRARKGGRHEPGCSLE